jgi:hypothetical protein
LNQVENWFARIQRDVITPGVFTPIKDLDKKLMRYIRHYNNNPKPLKWTFADPTRHIASDSYDSVDWQATSTECRPLHTREWKSLSYEC